MIDARKLSDTGLEQYIRTIIKGDEKSTELRKSLVESTARNNSFVEHVSENIGFEGSISLSLDENLRFNEQQFRSPTEAEEKILANINANCTPFTAVSPEYWGSVTLALIEAGVINSRFLAAKPNDKRKNKLTGGYRIDHAIKTEKCDELSRFILRSFLGHEKIRNTGYRDYYQFCPVSRAWWRNRLSEMSAQRNGLKAPEIHKQLTAHKGIWYHLSEKGVSKLTVISDVNIFSGITHNLVKNRISSQKECETITSFLGAQTTWRALGAFYPTEISEIIDDFRKQA